MNTTLLSRGRRLFYRPGVPNSTARHNVREWVRAIYAQLSGAEL